MQRSVIADFRAYSVAVATLLMVEQELIHRLDDPLTGGTLRSHTELAQHARGLRGVGVDDCVRSGEDKAIPRILGPIDNVSRRKCRVWLGNEACRFVLESSVGVLNQDWLLPRQNGLLSGGHVVQMSHLNGDLVPLSRPSWVRDVVQERVTSPGKLPLHQQPRSRCDVAIQFVCTHTQHTQPTTKAQSEQHLTIGQPEALTNRPSNQMPSVNIAPPLTHTAAFREY